VATREFTPLRFLYLFLLVVFIIVSAHDRRAGAWSMENRESRIVIRVGSSRSVLECGSPRRFGIMGEIPRSPSIFDSRLQLLWQNDLDAGQSGFARLHQWSSESIRDASTLTTPSLLSCGICC